jgi:predicted SAM-dependent methyltransferase
MKTLIKTLPGIRQMVAWQRSQREKQRCERLVAGTAAAATRFIEGPAPRRFQFGSGGHRLEGWFNTDFEPWQEGVFHLDMREPLPFPDDVLDVAASEHVFEHFSYDEGRKIVSELFRCLKPGGLIRMSLPDLDRYIALWNETLSEDQLAYMRAFVGIEHAGDPVTPCMTLNLAMRSFGHKFIYDRATLHNLLTKAGFVDVRFAIPADRSHLRLREFEVRAAEGNPVLDGYETMIVEAQKPQLAGRDG